MRQPKLRSQHRRNPDKKSNIMWEGKPWATKHHVPEWRQLKGKVAFRCASCDVTIMTHDPANGAGLRYQRYMENQEWGKHKFGRPRNRKVGPLFDAKGT